MNIQVIIWLALVVVFGVVEAATVQLTCIWFAAAALLSLAAAALGAQLWLQITIFVVVSALIIIFLRPIIKKKLQPHLTPTNADRAIGEIAVVTRDIDNVLGEGEAAVNGQRWTARSEGGERIPRDSRVRVLRIDGVKLIVEPLKINEEEELCRTR